MQPATEAGGAAGGGPLDFLRTNPQFIALRQIVQSNPMILQPMLQARARLCCPLMTLNIAPPSIWEDCNYCACAYNSSWLPLAAQGDAASEMQAASVMCHDMSCDLSSLDAASRHLRAGMREQG